MDYIIIFSGYNQRAVTAFLRTLSANQIENYLILASSPQDSIFKTQYASHVYAARTNHQLDLAEITAIIRRAQEEKGFRQFLVAPSTEALNRFLLRYEETFTRLGYRSSLPSQALYEQISDKSRFCALCAGRGIRIPQEIKFPERYERAFVAKPVSYSDADGAVYSPVLICSESDYQAFVREYAQAAFYYQRYVKGQSVYLLYYFPRRDQTGNHILTFSQENLMQQPGGKSILAARPGTFHLHPAAQQFKELFLSVGYVGFVMVEVRLSLGQYYMIEANPRFWGPSQLFVDAGYNFFEEYLWDYGFLEWQERNRAFHPDAKYFWHGGTKPSSDGRQPAFYSGFEKTYLKDFLEYAQWDIYRREDTERLFFEYE